MEIKALDVAAADVLGFRQIIQPGVVNVPEGEIVKIKRERGGSIKAIVRLPGVREPVVLRLFQTMIGLVSPCHLSPEKRREARKLVLEAWEKDARDQIKRGELQPPPSHVTTGRVLP